ncbi:MAG: molybdenum ABC transporter permease [Pedobacter sp.]|nr:MAG: molybdenum ABC transporter permease [Pedobacter sp.]
MNTSLLIGILLLCFGIYLRYWINKQKFNRRGPTGNEHFSSYEKAVATRSVEGLCKLLAYLFILTGLLLIIINW